MKFIVAYLIFSVLCCLYAAYLLKNAPTDVELWGEEIE